MLVEEPGARPASRTTRGSTTSRCSCRSARRSRAGSPMRRVTRCALEGPFRPHRQRGDLPAGPRTPRDRDLRRPAAASMGGARRADDHDGSARRRRPARRARRPATEPFDSLAAAPSWATSTSGRRDPVDGRLLSRPRRVRRDGPAREPGRVHQRRRLPPPRRRKHLGERRAGPPPAGTAALRHATIVLPDTAERDRLVGRLEAPATRSWKRRASDRLHSSGTPHRGERLSSRGMSRRR